MATLGGRAALAALLGTAAAGFAYGEYRRDIERARARIASGSRVAETARGPVEYAESGSGDAAVIVHGAGGGFDQGMAFGEALADRFKVIAMSRFGYLRTPLPADASPAAQADAHAALLDTLGIGRADLVGLSAGAPSALQFALRHPQRIRKLVLLVPAAYAERPEGAPAVESTRRIEVLSTTVLRSDFLFWAARKASPDTLVRSLLATPPELVKAASPDEQARVRLVLDLILPVSARRPGLTNDSAIVSSLQRYELEAIAAPTLAISCADDLFGTYDAARYTSEHVPNARFVGYSTGGHLWVGHHDEVVDELRRFLERE